MAQGLIHLYTGEGKGKTTAAMGLALRALGRGRKVTVLQFLKNGSSGEIRLLAELGAETVAGKRGEEFVSRMTEEEKDAVRMHQNELLSEVIESSCDMLVLDEACAAVRMGLVDRDLLRRALLERPAGREVILTGREPEQWMIDEADYITEMRCVRHPFEKGIPAREGIEY